MVGLLGDHAMGAQIVPRRLKVITGLNYRILLSSIGNWWAAPYDYQQRFPLLIEIFIVNTFTEHHGGKWSAKDMQHTWVQWICYTGLTKSRLQSSLGVLCMYNLTLRCFCSVLTPLGWAGGALGIWLSRNNQRSVIPSIMYVACLKTLSFIFLSLLVLFSLDGQCRSMLKLSWSQLKCIPCLVMFSCLQA